MRKKIVSSLTIFAFFLRLIIFPVSAQPTEWLVVRGDANNYAQTGSWSVSTTLKAVPSGETKCASLQAAANVGNATFFLPSDAPSGSYAIYYYVPHKTTGQTMYVNDQIVPFSIANYQTSTWSSDSQGAYLRLGGENITFNLIGDGTDYVRVVTNGGYARSTSAKFVWVGDVSQEKYYLNQTYNAPISDETPPNVCTINSVLSQSRQSFDGKSVLNITHTGTTQGDIGFPALFGGPATGKVVLDIGFYIENMIARLSFLGRDSISGQLFMHVDVSNTANGIKLVYYDGSATGTTSGGYGFEPRHWYRMIVVFDTDAATFDIHCYDTENNYKVEEVTGVRPKGASVAAGNCNINALTMQSHNTGGTASTTTTTYYDYYKLYEGFDFIPPTAPVPTSEEGPYTFQRIGLTSPGCTIVGSWTNATMPDSTGAASSLYGTYQGDYVEYATNLVEGWYDVYFWNIKYQTHQNPMKMTATIHSNNQTRTGILLPVNTTSEDRGGHWDKVGTYYFSGAEGEYVRLVSSGGEFARPADIQLEQNTTYEPPAVLSQGETVVAGTGSWPCEAIEGYFKVYVDGTLGTFSQIDLIRNKKICDSRYITFDGGWQYLGSYQFDDFDLLDMEEIIYNGSSGLNKMKFVYFTPQTLWVDSIILNNNSLGETYSFLQAGLHNVTATVVPKQNTNVQMVLALYEGNKLVETAFSGITNLTADSVTLSVSIPVTSVSDATVLKVLFWDSLAGLKPLSEGRIYTAEQRNNKRAPYLIMPASFNFLGTWFVTSDTNTMTGTILSGLTGSGTSSDASMILDVMEAGSYNLWVRSKNFTSNPSARYFNIKVNDQMAAKTFGQVGVDGYLWEDGGTITLQEGENMISLIDSSCYYAKLEAIYITKGTEIPPETYAELTQLAAPYKSYCGEMTKEEMMTDFVITRDFSGGNVSVLSKQKNVVTVAPDLSDTAAQWFYWNFKAKSDVSRSVNFKLESKSWAIINAGGVVYSTDEGLNWNYLPNTAGKREFSYSFHDGEEVWFSCTIPYVENDLTTFIDSIRNNPRVTVSTLCKSEQDRDVPLIVIGNPSAPKNISFTNRHHSCEATTSYLLEGAINYLINEADDSLFDEYCFYIVPMVDIDGVENGDQGKERKPHDHNRDYDKDRYAAIRAIKALYADKETEAAIDFHCPGISDALPYLYVYSGAETQINAFGTALKNATQNSEIKFDGSRDYACGNYYEANCSGFFRLHTNAKLATTLEFPYSGASVKYYPQNMRAFGKDTMIALIHYLNN